VSNRRSCMKDLGEGTAEVAKTMAANDPDQSRSPVR
jgi:hypothetical protein